MSFGKSSKLQNTKGPEKESILFVLKQTNSSVEILSNKIYNLLKKIGGYKKSQKKINENLYEILNKLTSGKHWWRQRKNNANNNNNQ